MQAEINSNKTVYFQWESPVRYYEPKSRAYLRALIALGVLLTLALFFFGEYLLILAVWSVVFVFYVKAAVPPQNALYKLTKFGFQFYEQTIPFQAMSSFTITHKPKSAILRIFITAETPYEVHVILPTGEMKDKILSLLEDKVPFIEHVPKTDIERFADWLSSLVGFA